MLRFIFYLLFMQRPLTWLSRFVRTTEVKIKKIYVIDFCNTLDETWICQGEYFITDEIID